MREPARLYAVLLRLYPAAFREEYEREMCAAFRYRWRQERSAPGRVLLLLAVLTDTLVTAAREHLAMLIYDVRYAFRALIKTPAFTAAALTTLALGVGATTAIYSLAHTVLLRPLPFADPERLVRVSETNKGLSIPDFSASVLNFLSWQEQARSFESLAAIRNTTATLTGDGVRMTRRPSSPSPERCLQWQ